MSQTKLGLKQQKFCDEWLVHGNGTRAYKCAYPNIKNDETAWACASRLLGSAKVQAYIAMRRAEMAAKYEIAQDRILKEKSYLAMSNIGELFKDGTILSPDKLPTPVKRAISSVEITEGPAGVKTYKYKFWDKGQALKRLSQHLGLYERDNKQKRPDLTEIFNALNEVPPELATAIMDKLDAD